MTEIGSYTTVHGNDLRLVQRTAFSVISHRRIKVESYSILYDGFYVGGIGWDCNLATLHERVSPVEVAEIEAGLSKILERPVTVNMIGERPKQNADFLSAMQAEGDFD